MKVSVLHGFSKLQEGCGALRTRFLAWCGADPSQAAALKRVGAFFAAMLIFTLVARGTAGATMPTVTTAHPAANIVEKSLTASGMVAAQGTLTLSSPEGLKVNRVLIRQGESVAAGDAVAELDQPAVDTALAEKKAELAGLQAKLTALNAADPVDSSALETAQLSLTIAQDNYNALAGESDPDKDERRRLSQAVQEAQLAYDQAVRAYQQKAADAGITGQTNAAAAQSVKLDIKAAKERIQALTQIQSNNYKLLSDAAGTVQTLTLSDGGTTTASAATLSDAQSSLLLTCALPSENVRLLSTGMELTAAQSTTQVKANITAISAPDDTGMVTLTAQLAAGALKAGETRVTVCLSRSRYDQTLPVEAVHTDNGGSFVYCVEQQDTVLGLQNVLVRIPVTVLQAGDTLAAVSGALSETDSVVISATKPLNAGARVRMSA
jgi:hypothetical protein